VNPNSFKTKQGVQVDIQRRPRVPRMYRVTVVAPRAEGKPTTRHTETIMGLSPMHAFNQVSDKLREKFSLPRTVTLLAESVTEVAATVGEVIKLAKVDA
jgi:hypothetical protein